MRCQIRAKKMGLLPNFHCFLRFKRCHIFFKMVNLRGSYGCANGYSKKGDSFNFLNGSWLIWFVTERYKYLVLYILKQHLILFQFYSAVLRSISYNWKYTWCPRTKNVQKLQTYGTIWKVSDDLVDKSQRIVGC